MFSVRAIGLIAVLGWQALSGGADALLHVCRADTQKVMTCHCPKSHAVQKQATEQTSIRRADCCATERIPSDHSPRLAQQVRPDLVAAPVMPGVLPALASDLDPARQIALRDVSPSQGPPVFLRIRTLLI